MFDIGGATAVKHHPFFEGIDWTKLFGLQVEPPLKPDLISNTDTSNFSAEFVDMALPRSLSHESLLSHAESVETSGADEVGEMFRGFSFVADTFIEEGDWQQHGQDSGFSFVQGGNDEPNGGRPKKVKGKRVRKKGKPKRVGPGTTAGAVVTGPPSVEEKDIEKSVVCEAGMLKPVFIREPVGQLESKPSSLAALLTAQQKDKRSPAVPSQPQRPNVWGSSTLPSPAPVPIPSGTPVQRPFIPARRLPARETGLPGRREDASGTFVWKRPV